jgi:hypothetical protein
MDKESELIWEAYSSFPGSSDLNSAVDILHQIFKQEGDIDDQYIKAVNELKDFDRDTIAHASRLLKQEYDIEIDGSYILELMAGDPVSPGDEYGWDDYE